MNDIQTRARELLRAEVPALDHLTEITVRSALRAIEHALSSPHNVGEGDVTQTDRDAAKSLLDDLKTHERLTGTFRSWDVTVQAFARHRLAALASLKDPSHAG